MAKTYREVHELRQRGAVNQLEPISAPKNLIVSEVPMWTWIVKEGEAGADHGAAYEAKVGHVEMILVTMRWSPGPRYCAEGIQDTLFSWWGGLNHIAALPVKAERAVTC